MNAMNDKGTFQDLQMNSSVDSLEESILGFLVRKAYELQYEGRLSEYDAFASISLLLIARLNYGSNVPLKSAIDSLTKDDKWANLGAYMASCMGCRMLENIWPVFCQMVLPGNQEKLYVVYCRALDIVVAGRRQIGVFHLPQSVVSQICSVVIRNESDRVINLACGEGAIVSDIVRSGYHNNIYAVESDPAKVFISKVRVFLNGGMPSLIFCADGLLEAKYLNEQCYDVVITNPPFGRRCPVYSTKSQLQCISDFRFDDIQHYETAYLIRSLELLKPGGHLAIFVPERVLCSATCSDFRKEVSRHADVLAIVSFAQHAIIGNCGCIQKSLLLLRKKMSPISGDGVKTCFGIVRHLGREVRQPFLGFDDFIEGFKSNGIGGESKSLFWRRVNEKDTWLPRAIVADEEFRKTYRPTSDDRIGNFLMQVNHIRDSETDDTQYFLVHDIDGIRKGTESFRIRKSGQIVRPYKVAAANDLLVTYKYGCLFVGVVPRECEGLVLDRASQMFAPLGYASGHMPDYQIPRIVEMLFSSLKYRRYLKDRFIGSVWKDDFVNFLMPVLRDKRKCAVLLENFDALKRRRARLINDMNSRLYFVGAAYKKIQMPGLNKAENLCMARHWPLVRLGDIIRARAVGPTVAGDVLQGLEFDENVIDRSYLSAFLMANANKLKIEDEIWQRTSRRYSQYWLNKIVLHLPDIKTQKKFGFYVENPISEFNMLLRELCKLRMDTSFSRTIDEELVNED